MSLHRKPLTPLEEEGLRHHGLPVGTPSQLSDVFRHGIAWAHASAKQRRLAVWCGDMPESNGKSNHTAILYWEGVSFVRSPLITLARTEYPDRARYEADRARYLIGELEEEPDILAYDTDKHSGYVEGIYSSPSHPILALGDIENDEERRRRYHLARLEARKPIAEVPDSQCGDDALHLHVPPVQEGKPTPAGVPDHAAAMALAEACFAQLKASGAINYQEQTFEVVDESGFSCEVVVFMQLGNKLTPHMLRMLADAGRDEARAARDEARAAGRTMGMLLQLAEHVLAEENFTSTGDVVATTPGERDAVRQQIQGYFGRVGEGQGSRP